MEPAPGTANGVTTPASSTSVGTAQPHAPAPAVAPKKAPHRPDPFTSIALALPVFLVYHLGILLIAGRAPADLVSTVTFALLDASVSAYVVTTLGLALLLSSIAWVQQKRGAVPSWAIGRVLLESALYALLLLVTVGYLVYRLGGGQALPPEAALSVFDKLVLAAGAGFHEELIFRGVLVSGGAFLLRKLGLPRGSAFVVTVIAASFAFAVCRFVGPLGEAFGLEALLYHALAGVALASIYVLRGFAVAVYTHAFYAALVFFVYA